MPSENVGGAFRYTILTIRKYLDGAEVANATYPLQLDIRMAFGSYLAVPEESFDLLTDSEYNARLSAFYHWISQTYPDTGLNTTTGATLVSTGEDYDLCPVPVPRTVVSLSSSQMENHGTPEEPVIVIVTTLTRAEDRGPVTVIMELQSSNDNVNWISISPSPAQAFDEGNLTAQHLFEGASSSLVYRIRLTSVTDETKYILDPDVAAPNWISVTTL